MAVTVPLLHPSDPRQGASIVPFHLPQWDPLWNESTDMFGTLAMTLAGAAMFTKNRLLAWPALLVSLASWLNATPLRTKEGASGGGLQGLTFAGVALLTVYLPSVLLLPDPSEARARVAARAAEKAAAAATAAVSA